jgi:hypothetical protein
VKRCLLNKWGPTGVTDPLGASSWAVCDRRLPRLLRRYAESPFRNGVYGPVPDEGVKVDITPLQ